MLYLNFFTLISGGKYKKIDVSHFFKIYYVPNALLVVTLQGIFCRRGNDISSVAHCTGAIH